MSKDNADRLRAAIDDARKTPVTAANELVQRTLARHGLAVPDGDKFTAAVQKVLPTKVMPTMASRLAGSQYLSPKASAHSIVIPDGAEFRQNQFNCTAGSRAFRTYVPSTAKDGVSGIVVMLHGCTQNPEDFAVGTGMNDLAEKHRFIVLYPQQMRGDNAQSCWNWFNQGDQQRDRGEPAILAGMTQLLMEEFGVAKDRTFVAGLSAGAAMAVILGETYPDIFSAVGAHSGLPFGAAKDVPSAFAAMAGTGAETVSRENANAPGARTIIFHGSADTTVHPSNGERIAQQVMDRSTSRLVETNEQGNTSGLSFNRKVFTKNDGLTELEHWVVEGQGHAWSGGQPGGSYIDPKGPDASAEMIRFFFEADGK